MPEPAYMPIPAHIHAIACALVKTKQEDESPVVISVEDITAYPVVIGVAIYVYPVYPVTFVARYAAHDTERHALTGARRKMITFAGWDCQHAVMESAAEAGQSVGDVGNV